MHSFDKAEGFARALIRLGWQIIASRETADFLARKGLKVMRLNAFIPIKEDFGFPPTLHPKIEACLTALRGERIDLVYVRPYPVSVGNDVGGRALLALAAKGKRIPVMDPSDIERILNELTRFGRISAFFHARLLDKTNAAIASHYDDLIKERCVHDALIGSFEYQLRNGENPYQVPASLFSLKRSDTLALHTFTQISGEAPCFTNLADMDSIVQTLCLASTAFRKRFGKVPFTCIVAKHGNPCGMGISWKSRVEAIDKALFGSPRSVWGGEAIVNFAIDKPLASLLYKSDKRKMICGEKAWMLDVVFAPSFTPEALRLLGKRRNRKLFVHKGLFSPVLSSASYMYRFVRGGFLRQPPFSFVLDFRNGKLCGKKLDRSSVESLIVAWSIAWSSNHGGNEVALASSGQLIGVGGGPSTVEAAEVAVSRALHCGHRIKNAVFAANAFFPFIDAPRVLAGHGVKAGVVPQGGKREALVKDFFRAQGVDVVYVPKQFRGFCRH